MQLLNNFGNPPNGGATKQCSDR